VIAVSSWSVFTDTNPPHPIFYVFYHLTPTATWAERKGPFTTHEQAKQWGESNLQVQKA